MRTYRQAILDGTRELLLEDPKVFLIGVGLSAPNAIFGTCKGLYEEFPGRVLEAPLSEGMLTGLIFGASLAGMKPMLIHQRINFAFLGMDQIINHIAAWPKMFPDHPPFHLMIRGIEGNNEWGAGHQHIGSYEQLFRTIDGVRVRTPCNAKMAHWYIKDLIDQPGLTIFIDNKSLYDHYYDEDLNITIIDPLPEVTAYQQFPMQKVNPMITPHQAWLKGYNFRKDLDA